MSATPAASALLEALRQRSAGVELQTAAAVTAPYLVDHRRLYHGQALAVALPESTAQLAALMGACDALDIAMVPQGGNTSYCGGATPDASGRQLVIGLARMNRVRAIDPANFSITVEAGCLLANVQRAAAEADCYFPLELGSAG